MPADPTLDEKIAALRQVAAFLAADWGILAGTREEVVTLGKILAATADGLEARQPEDARNELETWSMLEDLWTPNVDDAQWLIAQRRYITEKSNDNGVPHGPYTQGMAARFLRLLEAAEAEVGRLRAERDMVVDDFAADCAAAPPAANHTVRYPNAKTAAESASEYEQTTADHTEHDHELQRPTRATVDVGASSHSGSAGDNASAVGDQRGAGSVADHTERAREALGCKTRCKAENGCYHGLDAGVAAALAEEHAAAERAGAEKVLQAARACASYRCPVDDGYPPRCPDCGATVTGNDPVRGRCQSDVIRGIKADVIEAYLRRALPLPGEE